jgi:hypothetical protein
LLWYEEKGEVLEACYDGDIIRKQMKEDSHDSSSLNAKDLCGRFFNCWLFSCTCNKMSTRYISQSIDSGVFLKYNNSNGKYEQTRLSQSLWLLRREIHFFKSIMDNSGTSLSVKSDELKAYGDRQIKIPNKELAILLSVSDRRYNIIYSSKAILRAINGKEDLLERFIPKPFSPFKDIEEQLNRERPNENNVMNWALDKPIVKQ